MLCAVSGDEFSMHYGAEELFFVILPVAGGSLYYALYRMARESGQNSASDGLLWLVAAAVTLLVMNLSLYPVYRFAVARFMTIRVWLYIKST